MKRQQTIQLRVLALAIAAIPTFVLADDATTDPSQTASSKKDDQLVITGSRIPRLSKEGPTSVTVVTGKQLEEQGYVNVFDALNQQTQNTGFTQGADYGNTFTPAANTISLRGLGPNHTLILINGRRVADYPVAYEGTVNFVNLANIPSALVDRIEILNAGASAIYGSDAIAGVVNIILKKKADGIDVNVKLGTTQHGGGASQRLQVIGGGNFGSLNTVFAAEISNTDPIRATQRSFMSSSTLDGSDPTAVWRLNDLTQQQSLATGNVCNAFAGLFSNSTSSFTNSKGTYCGSGRAKPTYWTVRTKNLSENLYGGLTYDLNGGSTIFSDVSVGLNHTQNNTRGPSWTSNAVGAGYFVNQNTGDYEVWSRRFSPEELGNITNYNQHWHDTAVNFSAGIKGPIGNSTWNYETAYNISAYESRQRTPHFLAGIDTYFLGPQVGTDSAGIPIFAPNPTRFDNPLSPSQLNSLIGFSEGRNSSWSQTLSANATGEVVSLPAGPLQASVLAEVGGQGFSNKSDPQIAAGVFYNNSGTPDASGSRTRYATAAEFRVPVIKQLEATVAGRYDHYSFADTTNSKFTYNLGLVFRPTDTVLLRSNLASSFRAPDMNYIFQSKTQGYFSSTTDYYQCSLAGQPLSNCQYTNASPGANYTQFGSHNLKPENGRSFGYGVVWSPIKQFNFSADYWNIRINNEVTEIDADGLLRTENLCRTGVYNIASTLCQNTLSNIQRNPPNAILNPNAITNININPINASSETTSGIDLTGNLKWKTDDWGNYAWNINYTKVLRHKYQQYSNDQPQDLLNSLQNPDWPNKLINSLTWARADWTSTLTLIRYGKIPNQASTAYLSPTILTNWSIEYNLTKQATVSLAINNVFDKVKTDPSGGWPFYAVGNFLPYGREGWLEVNYHFN